MNTPVQKLLEISTFLQSKSLPERWESKPTGMVPETMSDIPQVLGSHNRTPYIGRNNANLIVHARNTMKTKDEMIRVMYEALEDQKQFLTWLGYDAKMIGDAYRKASRSKWTAIEKTTCICDELAEKILEK